MVEKPVLNNKERVTGQREIRPVWNNAQRVNHQNKVTHLHPKRNFIPTVVATKSGQVPVNTAKQSSSRAATSISNAMPKGFSAAKTNNFNEKVNTARVNNVTIAGPKAVVSAAEGNGENVVKSSACWIWRPTRNVIDHTSKDSGSYMLKRFNYVDLQGRLNLDRKSTSGGCQFLGKRLISWQCKKQTIVANFITEAEYVAAANCCGQNLVFHAKTKHIEIRHHFIRDSYENRLIQVIKIHTDHNVADLLTKAFDVSSISNEFGVKTGGCKVNAARQDLVLQGKS
ncbi:ribonuclease H-like domain-containing protein [Tanacetum coccineum]